MIQKVKSRKLNMPMLEIVITLGILTIVSVFIMKLFLGANSLETKAKDISKASILAQNIGETIKAAESTENAIKELGLIEDTKQAGTYYQYYDSQWKPQEEPGVYSMTVTISEEAYENAVLVTADIVVSKGKPYPIIKDDKEALAAITCKSYKQTTTSAVATE